MRLNCCEKRYDVEQEEEKEEKGSRGFIKFRTKKVNNGLKILFDINYVFFMIPPKFVLI